MKSKEFAAKYTAQVQFISDAHKEYKYHLLFEGKRFKILKASDKYLQALKMIIKNAQRGLSQLEHEYHRKKDVKKLPYLIIGDETFKEYKKRNGVMSNIARLNKKK